MATCRQCNEPTSILLKGIFTGLCPRCRARVIPVNLGCGTLIIIAFIVFVFSRSNDDVEFEISRLGSVVQELKKTVDSQTSEIQKLHSKIDKLTASPENIAEKT